MTPEEHARAKAIFTAARHMPPDRQDAYLAETCAGDANLLSHVQRLLGINESEATSDDHTATVPSAPSAASPAPVGPEVAEASFDLQPGDLFADRYRIITQLGQGGMGTVYRAQDQVLGQEVALKLLAARFGSDPQYLDQFKSEVRLAREVTHPNVCRVFDIGFVDNTCYLSMEYVGGDDLKTLLKRVGRVPEERARTIAIQIAGALAALHRKGVLHRDLKPANVMIDSDGDVRLTDFGLATRDHVAGAEAMAGTPAYMAPEQISGQGVTDRSDLYALGLVLYELFAGKKAFVGKTLAEYRQLHQAGEVTRPSHLVAEIPSEIEQVILRCLRKAPDDRPASADDVALALGGDVLGDLMRQGETPNPSLIAVAGSSERVAMRAVLASLVACVVLLAGLAWWLPARTRHAAQQLSQAPASLQVVADAFVRGQSEIGRDDDLAWGLTLDADCDLFVGARPVYWQSEGAGDAPLVWQRSAARQLSPLAADQLLFGGGRTTLVDPPRGAAAETTVVLNGQGGLVGYERALAQPLDQAGMEPDWAPFFAAAGLSVDTLASTDPRFAPRVYATERVAWRGPGLLVEAAHVGAVPTVFAVLRDAPVVEAETAWRLLMVNHGWDLLLLSLLVVSGPLAWINLRRGTSDTRGAFHLATLVLLVRMFDWLLSAHHTSEPLAEIRLFVLAGFGAFGSAAITWLYYVALEPYLRRFWPHTLVTWSRLTTGRWNDPLVGWHLLLGVALGLYFAALVRMDVVITELLGWTPRASLAPDEALLPLLGGRFAVAGVLGVMLTGLSHALAILLAVAILRAVIRRPMIAAVVAGLLFSMVTVPRGAHPLVSLVILGGGCVGVVIWAITRLGLLPVAIALGIARVMLVLPVEVDLRSWSADLAVLGLLGGLGAALLGAWLARYAGGAAPE